MKTLGLAKGYSGLGKTVYDDPNQPWLGSHEEPDAPAASTGSWFTNLVTKATDLYNANSKVLDPLRDNAIKTAIAQGTGSGLPAGSGNTGINQLVPTPLDDGSLSTGTKVAIGAGVLAVIGGVVYAVTRKTKKSMSGPGVGSDATDSADSTVFNGPKKRSKKRKK